MTEPVAPERPEARAPEPSAEPAPAPPEPEPEKEIRCTLCGLRACWS